MSQNDSLRQLLVEFFNLPEGTMPEDLTQKTVPKWDSLAMVQLIAEIQSAYNVQFDLDEIEHLGSHTEIRAALVKKGANV
jgi:acyl carrier protein